MQTCERCKAVPDGEYALWDYCAKCSKNLCDNCMKNGCCRKRPAVSGMAQDYPDKRPLKLRCGHNSRTTRLGCSRPRGHKGRHQFEVEDSDWKKHIEESR